MNLAPTNREAEASPLPAPPIAPGAATSTSGDLAADAARPPTIGSEESPGSVIAIPVIRYYKPDELSVRPTILQPLPDSIDRSWPLARPGRAVIRIYIGEDGSVENIKLEESDLPAEFDSLVVGAMTNSLFTPGQIEGRNVRSQIRIEIRFESEASIN
ncbi:MAG TPA: TonB family protein [Rhodocyclaceae bacterium]